jgi:hypothetical protein
LAGPCCAWQEPSNCSWLSLMWRSHSPNRSVFFSSSSRRTNSSSSFTAVLPLRARLLAGQFLETPPRTSARTAPPARMVSRESTSRPSTTAQPSLTSPRLPARTCSCEKTSWGGQPNDTDTTTSQHSCRSDPANAPSVHVPLGRSQAEAVEQATVNQRGGHAGIENGLSELWRRGNAGAVPADDTQGQTT